MWNPLTAVCFLALFACYDFQDLNSTTSDNMNVIIINKRPVCGGGLIVSTSGSKYLLTAAHCVFKHSPSAVQVQISPGGSAKPVQSVSHIFVHPYYTPPSVDYDIAILRIDSPSPPITSSTTVSQKMEDSPETTTSTETPSTTTSTVTPSTTTTAKPPEGLVLSKTEPSSNDQITIINWNSKESQSTSVAASLEVRKSCKTKLSGKVTVTTKMICLNANADSVLDGTPVIVNERNIAGVISYTPKANQNNLPRVATNFANSEIYSFIERYVPL